MTTWDYEPEEDTRARAAAENGLHWLMEVGPRHGLDWTRIGQIREIRASGDQSCPLGQASSYSMFVNSEGSYTMTMTRLVKAGDTTWPAMAQWAYQHGFADHGNAGEYIPYSALDKAWKQLIAETRETAGLPA